MITIPVITERCAGIDVGKRGLAAAVAVGPADKEAEIKTRWFATTMPALHDLRQWLLEEGCTTVAMESTGSWWISIKNELEDDLRITLVCARKHHPKKGDKTDFRDAVDLALHHRHGLLTGSFLPERGIVELRDLTRRRKKLLGNLSSEKNRIQKVLDTAGVKMGNERPPARFTSRLHYSRREIDDWRRGWIKVLKTLDSSIFTAGVNRIRRAEPELPLNHAGANEFYPNSSATGCPRSVIGAGRLPE